MAAHPIVRNKVDMTDLDAERIPIGWEGLRTARDLGGLPLLDGGVTQPVIVIRSDTPVRLTAAGLEQALRHQIHTVVDLREEGLAEAHPNPFADAPDVTYHHLPLLPEDFPLPVIRGGYREALGDHDHRHDQRRDAPAAEVGEQVGEQVVGEEAEASRWRRA